MKRPWNFVAVIIPTLLQVVIFKLSWFEALIFLFISWYVFCVEVEDTRRKLGLRKALALPVIYTLAVICIFYPSDWLFGAAVMLGILLIWFLSIVVWEALLGTKLAIFLVTFDAMADILFVPGVML